MSYHVSPRTCHIFLLSLLNNRVFGNSETSPRGVVQTSNHSDCAAEKRPGSRACGPWRASARISRTRGTRRGGRCGVERVRVISKHYDPSFSAALLHFKTWIE